MVGAEHTRSSIQRVLVHPMDLGFPHRSAAVPNQQVVQYEAWQGVKGVPPGRCGRRHLKRETEKMPRLQGSARCAEPVAARRPSGVEVGAHQPDAPAGNAHLGRNRHSPLQDEGQLDRMRVPQRERRQYGIAPITL